MKLNEYVLKPMNEVIAEMDLIDICFMVPISLLLLFLFRMVMKLN